MKRRQSKRDKLEQMLEAWGYWKNNLAPALGHNVNMLDFSGDVPRGVQKRNDVYSNPVDQEHKRMMEEYKVCMTVDDAILELPRAQKAAIKAKYCIWGEASQDLIAEKMGISKQSFSNALSRAYWRLDDTLLGLSIEYRVAS